MPDTPTTPKMVQNYAELAALANRMDEIKESRKRMLKEYRKYERATRREIDTVRAAIRAATENGGE